MCEIMSKIWSSLYRAVESEATGVDASTIVGPSQLTVGDHPANLCGHELLARLSAPWTDHPKSDLNAWG